MEREKIIVASFDFDGVLFERPIPAQMALLKWAFKPLAYNKPFRPKLTECPQAQYPRINLTPREQNELRSHSNRLIKPGMKEFVQSIPADIKIGNTGRSNTQPMVDMTKCHLLEDNILDLLDDVKFRLEGVSSDESKYWHFMEMKAKGQDFVHFDDNAYFTKRMAPHFPNDRFVIVQDLSSGILFSRKEMKKYPNVSRIAIDKKGNITQIYPPLQMAA